jgi:DNA ligase-1
MTANHMTANQKNKIMTEKPFFPMLAHEFNKRAGVIQFPCLVQPKLDGIRLIAGKTNVNTRNGRPILEMAGLHETLRNLPDSLYLDGEMYVHGMPFEEISSLFKKLQNQTHISKDKLELITKLEYHVYDCFDVNHPDLAFSQRIEVARSAVDNLMALPTKCKLVCVHTLIVDNSNGVHNAHNLFVEQGYEGIMVRNKNAPYEPGKRSTHLLKLKHFETSDFQIMGVVEAEGLDKGTAIFVCASHLPTHKIFNVRLKASRVVRSDIWAVFNSRPSKFLGKMLTVRYQELTTHGIPRFPIGIAVRDYE